ncbi:MAG: hypothetical protein JWO13_827 [Acidobacteriales bacterium]|nr:hypothetical protein [Terriglobales bacterium]
MLAKLAAGAFIGGIATRGLTQQVLGDKNTGYMGYGANAIAAILLGYGANKLGAPPAVASGVVAGGFSALIQRIWSEKVSQTSPAAMAGLGDIDYSANGLGDYVASGFPLPSVSQQQGNYQVVPVGGGSIPTGTDITPAAGANSRFANRYA